MATERQIAANRRNAQKSTGPKSASGKKRSSKNAHRHGLSVRVRGEEAASAELTQLFGEGATDERILTLAERVAMAQRELARVHNFKNAMLEYARLLYSSGTDFNDAEEVRRLLRNWARSRAVRGRQFERIKGAPQQTADSEEEEQVFLEIMCCLLPELLGLDRYRKVAIGRRNRAIREISKLMN